MNVSVFPFSDFAECLFSKGTTWPLVISLLAFSGALAVECSRNGRSILVKSVRDWATVFMVMRLKEWIIDNGKWVSTIETPIENVFVGTRSQVHTRTLLYTEHTQIQSHARTCTHTINTNTYTHTPRTPHHTHTHTHTHTHHTPYILESILDFYLDIFKN